MKGRQILGREIKNKAVEHESDGDINCNWCTWNGSERLGMEIRENGNQKKN